MTPKEYLELAYRVDRAIRLRKEIAKKHRESLYGRSINYADSRTNAAVKDSLGKAIGQVADYESETDLIVSKLVPIRLEIERSIQAIANRNQREVLKFRYLLYMPWKNIYDKDTGELLKEGIQERMGYSPESIYKYHASGLKKITVPEKITVNYSELQSLL